MVNLTVAICTYNGALRLPEVLDCLTAQTVSELISWEIIVVDNNHHS
ncbi:glycosyltransferase family 2 protein [Leptolyngbya sp. PCC 6406]